MDRNQVDVSGSFLIEWIVVCAITALAGGFLAFMSMWTVGELATDTLGETAGWLVAGGLFGLLFGGGICAGQGFLMRKAGVSVGKWVRDSALAAAAGVGIGFATMALLLGGLEEVPEAVAGASIGLFLGLPVALAQWRILRAHIPNAGTWIAIAALAPVVALTIGLPLSGEDRGLLVLGLVGILVAVITGVGMAYLLRRESAVAY